MTDKLRQAAEMALEALKDMNCGWRYIRESHGDLYGVGWDRSQEKADDAIKALRQALDQFPDTTKMIKPSSHKDLALKYGIDALLEFATDETPEGWWKAIDAIGAMRQALAQPDTGTDRGAWSDVPDATKWVDELRGDDGLEEPPNSTTDVVEPVAWVYLGLWKTGQHWPDDCFNSEGGEGMTPLYTAPIKRKGGQYAKECEAEVQRLKEIIDELENDDPPPQCEWVGLTDEEIVKASIGHVEGEHMLPHSFARAIEAKLKEKNHD